VGLKKARQDQGFTLMYAVVLSVVFASLLYGIYYFLKINLNESSKGIFKLQTIYLAESGNNRALARMNVLSLPELDLEDIELDELAEDEEDFFAEDDDFWDED
jgi:type II secretory pathway component PulJ